MFGIFKCKHPFKSLAVYKEQTIKVKDCDFEQVDYHLYCQKCNTRVTLSHSNMIGGVSTFLDRGRVY